MNAVSGGVAAPDVMSYLRLGCSFRGGAVETLIR
jgi:hypothetical protein